MAQEHPEKGWIHFRANHWAFLERSPLNGRWDMGETFWLRPSGPSFQTSLGLDVSLLWQGKRSSWRTQRMRPLAMRYSPMAMSLEASLMIEAMALPPPVRVAPASRTPTREEALTHAGFRRDPAQPLQSWKPGFDMFRHIRTQVLHLRAQGSTSEFWTKVRK